MQISPLPSLGAISLPHQTLGTPTLSLSCVSFYISFQSFQLGSQLAEGATGPVVLASLCFQCHV